MTALQRAITPFRQTDRYVLITKKANKWDMMFSLRRIVTAHAQTSFQTRLSTVTVLARVHSFLVYSNASGVLLVTLKHGGNLYVPSLFR